METNKYFIGWINDTTTVMLTVDIEDNKMSTLCKVYDKTFNETIYEVRSKTDLISLLEHAKKNLAIFSVRETVNNIPDFIEKVKDWEMNSILKADSREFIPAQ